MSANERVLSIFTGSVEDEICETITSLFNEEHFLIGKKTILYFWRGKNLSFSTLLFALGSNGTLVSSKHYLDKETCTARLRKSIVQ